MSMSNGVTGGNFTTLADLQASKPRVNTVVTLNGVTYLVEASDKGNGIAVNGLFANPVLDRDLTKSLYVDASTGLDSNDGSVSSQFLTIQKALDVWAVDAETNPIKTTIFLNGTFTEGGVASDVRNIAELVVDGVNNANTILDGTSATTVMGLNFNNLNNVRVKNVEVKNWGGVGSGIIFQNSTRGVIDTCIGTNNAEANFNCSEDSELVMIGVCSSVGSKFGIRIYRNSGASIGDNTNAITIDGATQAGIVSRDGSMVVTLDNLTVTNCNSTGTTAGIVIQKGGYLELRTCTVSNNSIGAFVENNSIIDTQTGTRTFSGNTQDYRIVDNSADRELFSASSDVMHKWIPRSNPSGLGVSSNYDLVLDYLGATGFQFLTNGNNVNIDFDKKSRITHVASDNSLRLVANNADIVRLLAAPAANRSGMLLLVNDGTTTSLRTVKVGAADSGGAGQRLLTVDN